MPLTRRLWMMPASRGRSAVPASRILTADCICSACEGRASSDQYERYSQGYGRVRPKGRTRRRLPGSHWLRTRAAPASMPRELPSGTRSAAQGTWTGERATLLIDGKAGVHDDAAGSEAESSRGRVGGLFSAR